MTRGLGRTAGLGWAALVLAGCALAACGNVIVDERGGLGGEPGTGGGLLTTSTSSSFTLTTTTSSSTWTTTTTTSTWTTTTTEESTSGPSTGCVNSCAQAFINGTMPCYGLGFALYGQLVSKVCDSGNPCDVPCQGNLCSFTASSAACTACIDQQNPEELQTCLSH